MTLAYATAALKSTHLLDWLVKVLGVEAVRGAELLGDLELGGVHVDGEDAGRTLELGALSLVHFIMRR